MNDKKATDQSSTSRVHRDIQNIVCEFKQRAIISTNLHCFTLANGDLRGVEISPRTLQPPHGFENELLITNSVNGNVELMSSFHQL